MAATDGIDLQNPDLVKKAFKPAFQNGAGAFNHVSGGFEYTVESPVSYTHLTLPTTPYV